MTRSQKVRPKRSFGTLRQRAGGRWQAYYKGEDDKTHYAPKTFAAKIDGEAWLAAERRKMDLGTWAPPGTDAQPRGGLTLAKYCDTWLEQRVLKPRTRTLYAGYLKNVIKPELGDLRLTGLTAPRVREWYAGLDAQYPTRNANAYALLRTIMASAVDDELLAANPCRVRSGSVKHRKHEPIALSANEIRALADAMPGKYRAHVLLAGFSGLRWGELAALRRGDIDMTENGFSVTVRRAVVRVNGKLVTDRPKSTAALRSVPLPDGLRPVLADHLKRFAGRELVFPAAAGGLLHDSTLRKPFRRAAEAIGYPSMKWHDLRHSAATLFAQAGATLADHMSLMGHTSAAMSARYTATNAMRARGLVAGLFEAA